MGTVNEDVRVRVYDEGAQELARRLGAIENRIEKLGKESKKAGKEMSTLGSIAKGAAVAFAGLQLGHAVKGVLEFDSALGQLQADIGMSNSDAMSLRERILALSSSYGVMKEEVLAAYQTFQGFAGDITKYKGTMDALVMTHKATGSSLEDLAKLQATLVDSLMMSPEAAMEGIGALRAYANAGTIELRNMASELPQIMGVSSSLGFTGQRGVQQVGTMLAVAGQAFGGRSEEARTSVNAMFTDLQKKAKDLKSVLGIEVFNKDGSMKDVTEIMDLVAKKTDYGTKRGKAGLINFFTESSLKTASTWMTMLKTGKVNVIHEQGKAGKFADIEEAYKKRMEGIGSEAEMLKAAMASLNSAFAEAAKTMIGFIAANPGLSGGVAAGALAAPALAKGVMAAGAGMAGASAAAGGGVAGATAALGTATTWLTGILAAGAAGAAIGHYGVDKGLGKMLFGKSMSDTFADRAINKEQLAASSARRQREISRIGAIEQVRAMTALETSGVRKFGGTEAIVAAAIKAQGLGGNAEVVAELKRISEELRASAPKVVVKPAGGIDKISAQSSRSKQ